MKKLIAVLFVGVFLCCGVASADTMFYTDRSSWEFAISGLIEDFAITTTSITLADEVSSIPSAEQQLSSQLTFDKNNTGLSTSFTLETLQPGAKFTWDDSGSGPQWDNVLSVGKVDTHEVDDWQISFLTNPVYAFGFDLRDNDETSSDELFSVYGIDDLLLGETTDIPYGTATPYFFLGVVSTDFISRAVFHEDLGIDDNGIGGVSFSAATVPVPEPTTIILLGTGLFGLAGYKRKMRKS